MASSIYLSVISIRTEIDRRSRMQEQLNRLGLKAVWIDGVDTRGRKQGSGFVGCYISHLFAYRHFLLSESECCLILEDDAVLDSEIVRYLEAISTAAKEIDLIFLADEHPQKPNLHIGRIGSDRQLCTKRFASTGGYAYTINRRAAERILKRYQEVKMQIDVLLHSWWRTGLLTAYVSPVLAQHGQEESLIGPGRPRVRHRMDHKIKRHLCFGLQRRKVRQAYLRAFKKE